MFNSFVYGIRTTAKAFYSTHNDKIKLNAFVTTQTTNIGIGCRFRHSLSFATLLIFHHRIGLAKHRKFYIIRAFFSVSGSFVQFFALSN